MICINFYNDKCACKYYQTWPYSLNFCYVNILEIKYNYKPKFLEIRFVLGLVKNVKGFAKAVKKNPLISLYVA